MSGSLDCARQSARRDHVVAVYDDDRDVVAAIATFFIEALDDGGVAIVVATPPHRMALEAQLASQGYATEALIETGNYHALDAADMLAAFMSGDRIDPIAFASVIGPILDAAERRGGPIRVFGEMVALLWDAGNVGAAVELESLWNDVVAQHSFALFCAYAMSSLETRGDLAAAKSMCDRHSSVIRLPTSLAEGRGRDLGPGKDHYERLFVATPATLRYVRNFVRAALCVWGEDRRSGEAEVIASELATNAVEHARSPFVVSISRAELAISIAVRDASFEPPEDLRSGAGPLGGRGVWLVAELSRAWGVRREADGKTVWAEVARSGAGSTSELT